MKKIMMISILVTLLSSGAFAQRPNPRYNDAAVRGYNNFSKDLPFGISEKDAAKSIYVVNPVLGTIDIKAMDDVDITRVEIYGMDGSLALSEATHGNNILVSSESLARGIYLLRVYYNAGSFTRSIYKA